MAILNNIELSADEESKIAHSLNESETEALQTEAILKEQAERENQQMNTSRTIAVTLISVSCAVLAFFGIGIMLFASIFAPQH